MKRTDHHTIQQILDGSISKQAFAKFQQRMRVDPELSKLYGEYALLSHSLSEEYGDRPVVSKLAPIPRQIRPARLTWIAAAAALAMLAAAFYYKKPPSSATAAAVTASIRFSNDAVWQIQGGGSPDLVKGSTLELLQGQASVSPNSSATAVIEGPATLTFVSADSLHLAEGRGFFHMDNPERKLEVTTGSLSAVDLGTAFGIEAHRDRPDELHVIEGKVQLRINGKTDTQILATGEAARISGADSIERFPSEVGRFHTALGEFQTVLSGPFVKADWRVDYGNPSISADRVEGVNYTAFRKLPEPQPNDDNPVLLVTLDVGRPSNGDFHTDGWAGLSFFRNGVELLFFGDSFGPERTWSLDVKQKNPVILPGNPVFGPRTVTLRFDRRTGEVSLHQGTIPLSAAFCSGKLPAGVTFDEIRIGASSSAALSIRSLVIQAGGGR